MLICFEEMDGIAVKRTGIAVEKASLHVRHASDTVDYSVSEMRDARNAIEDSAMGHLWIVSPRIALTREARHVGELDK